MSEKPANRPKWLAVLLVLIPLWLFISGAVAVRNFIVRDKKQDRLEQEHFAKKVSAASIADDLRKLVEVIGERNDSSETAAANLSKTSAMIEGLLGPSNTGYKVHKEHGPAEWPILRATLHGRKPEAPAVWVLTSYDSRPGSPGAEANATGLAATLAAAQALAAEKPEMSIHFVFLPHTNDPESPILDTLNKIRRAISTSPKAILCVEAMGAGSELWLSSRDTTAAPLALANGLGTIRGAETICLGEDSDLSSILFEMNLPAVRVATRAMVIPSETDDKMPSPTLLATSAGRLVELIRRCAGLP